MVNRLIQLNREIREDPNNPRLWIEVAAERCESYTMAVLSNGPGARISARQDARLIVVGGEPLGPRRMWWNFVSTSMARIDQAKDDWQAGRFTSVPGDGEFIPLPGS